MKFRNIFYKSIAKIKYLKAKLFYNGKINLMLKKNNCEAISPDYKNKIHRAFSKHGFNRVSTKWHKFYNSYLGGEIIEFIPELFFYYKIEPALNNSIFYPALEDKNLLNKFFDEGVFTKINCKKYKWLFLHW